MKQVMREWHKYEHLPAPKPKVLIGRWRIRMDTWWGWMFRNVKVIEISHPEYFTELGGAPTQTRLVAKGYNVAFGVKEWGKFGVNKGGELRYRNGMIVDKLVQITPDMMKGLFIWKGKPRYTFTMERIP